MRKITNPFLSIRLSIVWWPATLLLIIVVYYLVEDYLERYLNLPRIYHRRRLVLVYIAVVITICFPETLYDLLMVGVDLVLLGCHSLGSLYLDLCKWLIQFWIQIKELGEMQPKEIPMDTNWIVGWNSSIFRGRGRIRIVVSIDRETFVTIRKMVRPFLVWLKLLIKKFEAVTGYFYPFARYFYNWGILILENIFVYVWEAYKVFHKYLWPRDFRVLINRILFFKFLEKTLLPICRALWKMVKYCRREIIESWPRIWKKIWKKIREFLFW